MPRNDWEHHLSNLVRVSDGQSVPKEEWPTVPGAAVALDKRRQWVPDEQDEDAEETEDAEPVEAEQDDQGEDDEDLWDEEYGEEDREDGEYVDVIAQRWLWPRPRGRWTLPPLRVPERERRPEEHPDRPRGGRRSRRGRGRGEAGRASSPGAR